MGCFEIFMFKMFKIEPNFKNFKIFKFLFFYCKGRFKSFPMTCLRTLYDHFGQSYLILNISEHSKTQFLIFGITLPKMNIFQ